MSYSSLMELHSHISKYEISRNYLFDVKISYRMNSLLSNVLYNRTKDLTFSCYGAELPGRSFSTIDQKIYGVVQKFPALTSYSDITLEFICRDTDFIEKYIFDDWFDLINISSNNFGVSNESNPLFNFEYKTEYSADIIITQYSQSGEPIYVISLIEAFPITINPVSLNWGGDGFNKLSVTFAYTKWVNLEVPFEPPEKINYPKENLESNVLALLANESRAKSLISNPVSILGTASTAYTIYKAATSSSPGTSFGTIASVLPGMGISNFTISNLINGNYTPQDKGIKNLTNTNSSSETSPSKSRFPNT